MKELDFDHDATLPGKLAVLYQALEPPIIDGLRKDAKPGGYSDSGADIAFALKDLIPLATPSGSPDPAIALDWVFPDTIEGITTAIQAGADVIWANTVLFRGHPLEQFLGKVSIVGQIPFRQEEGDQKFLTNTKLKELGLPVAESRMITGSPDGGLTSMVEFSGVKFPCILKPVRGRGSQGVTLVEGVKALAEEIHNLATDARFGDQFIVEEFLKGEELTVTAMPPELSSSPDKNRPEPWSLIPVRRLNHQNGVAPYNGVQEVVLNSCAITPEECARPEVQRLLVACVEAFKIVGAMAPIRIDARAGEDGEFKLFDLNMKPNMTGAGRPGRELQDSLSALAARAMGWTYQDFLIRMLKSSWILRRTDWPARIPNRRQRLMHLLHRDRPGFFDSLHGDVCLDITDAADTP